MTEQPIVGQLYRYIGTEPVYAAYSGLVGTASRVTKRGRNWEVDLSNVREWTAKGLSPIIYVTNRELTPVQAAEQVQLPKGPAEEGLEADLVADIIHALKVNGYGACVVGQLRAKGSGTTIGYPDLSVRHPSYPRGLACLIEVKTAEGTLSTEQEDLHKDGWSHVVRSVQEALSTLLAFENEVFGCK